MSDAVATAILTLAERPGVLAERLDPFEHALVHGDLRLGNLGFYGDRIVLIDWGERVGGAPPAVELAWFLGFDAYRLDVTPEEVIGDFRAREGARSDETALQLALIGGLVQLGGSCRSRSYPRSTRRSNASTGRHGRTCGGGTQPWPTP